ncbi:MAG: DNA-directed RNA polymerase subunit omega [candidate division KSB1 bacterium]|nr:DNA-directed RNA polymerase subunit omega [candidate division KSB1 bacterium]MDZ7333903.1 DNA-directed RNA polymerase subunit omega [candidate division KSB1 bacterium]MDZ7358348.1 DNA-directed RNA polymerase subunit omega [candidate division KSB1 bacterium]MDZ7377174.1 DNA-directed RNA polymerase subunit omega [candidate division KSB1 bacterium]MDZ7399149.1 DNA-directed RNA polymerase subunit omega [candidate division KSB1 bacterium]
MSSTLPLNELEKLSNNIYEAIIVIAKRARQINEEQKRLIDVETQMDDSVDDYDDDEEMRETEEPEATKKKVLKLPKPTEQAIQEMLAGKIKWDYGLEPEMEEREN